MQLMVQAYRLRQQAREVLRCGDAVAASSSIGQAQDLQNTPQGRSLRLLVHWLNQTTGQSDSKATR
jgi:hypothetical protein